MNKAPQCPTILIVDDVSANVQVLGEALHSDYKVKVANSGLQALDIARHKPQPDLILLDVMMPEMDGFEVCRRLKSNPQTWKIPVIFVTARGGESDEELGLDLGAVDYITKPISIAIARARIRNHIRLKQQADLLESISMVDALTRIPNRRRFDETLDAEWKRAAREKTGLSLLMVDIDQFKQYNDHYGHGAGDICLESVAAALQAGVSRPGDLVARYGGEEFAVILPETGREAACEIAARLCECVRNLKLPHGYSKAGAFVTVSIGGATMQPSIEDGSPDALLGRADKMLYKAKNTGRDRACCEPGEQEM
ncbi:MAG: PleD family two-component system response regulator [Gallionellaceae bacterium]|nr:PleD family two-component system response regulator [Gallionellaceae bacterium]